MNLPWLISRILSNISILEGRVRSIPFESPRLLTSAALHLLEQKRVAGTEVDSSARHPPPKCHPETRQSLRSRITTWFTSGKRDWNMLWLFGPAGVGKSAVAQTIAEQFKASGSLGAAFFFSRLNDRDDPMSVIPTLAYQLATLHSDYRQVITQRLADDPTLLEKKLRTQFRELIIEPFKALMASKPHISQKPLLILLDGLDECSSKEAQCEFVDLICEHVRVTDTFPLLWMICSRPEWHLKGIFSNADFHANCAREELLIDDAEAQADAYRVLQDGFLKIQQKFWDIFDANKPWPKEATIRRIARASSGLFSFTDTILRFIGDQEQGDPAAQLEICLRFINNLTLPGAINPLHALDLLYRQVLSDVPAHILPTTMRILGFCILYPSHSFTACELSNFLCLSRGSFYTALQNLHSVLDIPTPPHCFERRIGLYHASFGEFLKNPRRSGHLALDVAWVWYDVATHCLRWNNALIASECRHQGEICPDNLGATLIC